MIPWIQSEELPAELGTRGHLLQIELLFPFNKSVQNSAQLTIFFIITYFSILKVPVNILRLVEEI